MCSGALLDPPVTSLLPSPPGQKQPKVQKLEQACWGLEQVLTQASPHSWYTWLAAHWPKAAGTRGLRESPPLLPRPAKGPAQPSSTRSPSVSQTWGGGAAARGAFPQDSQQRPGPLQLLTAWPAMLHWREYSDSVTQVQSCRPGGTHAAMSTWQLSTNVSLGTLHSGDTRASSWLQIWAWAEGHSGFWGSRPIPRQP